MAYSTEKTVDQNGYGEGAPSVGGKAAASIRVSELPHHLRATASKLDLDQDGALGAEEVASVFSDLDKKKKVNRLLQRTVLAFVVVTFLLIACIFGASITAARLSQDITINHENGFAYIKGSSSDVMKTSEAVVFKQGVNIGEMSDMQLADLKEIILEQGSLRFQVKGHARDAVDDLIILLVQGGTITYNADGIVDARGDAKFLLETVYGPNDQTDVRKRGLGWSTCWVTCSADDVIVVNPKYDDHGWFY